MRVPTRISGGSRSKEPTLASGAVNGVEWHFFPNAAGAVGPSGPLLNALQKAGFTVIIH